MMMMMMNVSNGKRKESNGRVMQWISIMAGKMRD